MAKWRSVKVDGVPEEGGPNEFTYAFFQSFYEGRDSITPEKQHIATWVSHGHAANEIMLTHWWDGPDKPAAPPNIPEGERRPTKPMPDWARRNLEGWL